MSSVGSIFRLGRKLGSGAFSIVFEAHEISTGTVVALKKSRVSLRIRRTLMHYEARVLRLLAGHPSIPAVFAHGRLEHFEYLAMQFLGRSLGDVIEHQGKLPLKYVLRIADQMLSVLGHIHSRQIVHRDIKPDNIMLPTHENDFSVVYLIDFGLARPTFKHDPNTHNLVEERRNLVGTLAWASLNAHNGIDLSPRDDLESLAYTLLFLLRGELPWQKLCKHGTVFGRMTQVREKKRAWPGSRLAEGYPPFFGYLLDYARGLKFHEPIDYGRFRAQLEVLQRAASDRTESDTADQPKPSHIDGLEKNERPFEVGQLVYIQIISNTSIEGHSMQAIDKSLWHDPSLSSDEWRTAIRPGIVIEATFDHISLLPKILVVSLGHGTPENGTNTIPVSTGSSQAAKGETIMTDPAWEMSETYCYAFPRATWFYCLPVKERTPAPWTITSESIRLLRERFAPPLSWSYWAETENDPDRDVRHNTRMQRHSVKVFVKATALGPLDLASMKTSGVVDWRGDRGWFDERVRIARRRGQDDGFEWTTSDKSVHDEDEDSCVSDSYEELDHSLWENRQQERDRSLTLELDQQDIHDEGCGKEALGTILQIFE